MPNGSDCGSILQTENLVVPTQWYVFDCTSDGRVKGWLDKDSENDVDYCWVGELAGDALDWDDQDSKKRYVRARPELLSRFMNSYEMRCGNGSEGRLVIWFVGDIDCRLSRRFLVELPLDITNALFWRINYVPAVLRVGLGLSTDSRMDFLSEINHQYFQTPEFSAAYYGQHEPKRVYSNLFDSCLLSKDGSSARKVVESLVPLHRDETRYAMQHRQSHRGGGMLIIEEAMRGSLAWRRIDWLAITLYPCFPRLWDLDREDILEVLDYSRCPQRTEDPLAVMNKTKREENWDHLKLRKTDFDLLLGEQPYRVSLGDTGTRLYLSRFLLKHNLIEEVLQQCQQAKDEVTGELASHWLKIEGLALQRTGREEEGAALLERYRNILCAEADPIAHTLDEIAAMFLFESKWREATEYAVQAIEKDPLHLHAYDCLVIAARKSNNPQFEDHAKVLATQHGVRIPIHVREEQNAILSKAKVHILPDKPKKKWWKFW